MSIAVIIIHSCRKDINQKASSPAAAALISNGINISMLKSNYNKGVAASKLKLADVSQQTLNSIISSLTVDWTTYTLNTYPDSTQVIEFAMPDDTSLLIPGTLKVNDTLKYHTKTSAVFILRKDTVNMSFFMKTVEDCTSPGYQSVINNLSYNMEPPSFNGNIYYFSLARQYINGYQWLNGTPVNTLSIAGSSTQQQTQSSKTGKQVINEIAVTNCLVDVYGVYNVTISQYGDISWQDQVGTITVTTCTITDSGSGGGGGGTTSTGTTGGGGVTGATPLPKPCTTSPVAASIKGHLVIDVVQGSGGSSGTTSPCAVVVATSNTKIFGLNNSNAQILDTNFDNYLAYVQSLGYSYSNSFNTVLNVNGIAYTGQVTEVYNANGQVVAAYFSPDVTSGPSQTGTEYSIGNGNDANSASVSGTSSIIFGATSTVGNGTATYYPSSGGKAGTTQPVASIITTILSHDFPCATVNILNVLNTIPAYTALTAPFATLRKPDLTWQDGSLGWAVAVPNTTQLTYTLGVTSTSNRNANITLNTKMLQQSSQLMIAAAVIHETLHAYINYLIVTNINFSPPAAYNGSKPWMVSLDYWALEYGIPPNYRDHYAMLSDYFSKAVAILKAWDKGAHTDQEYEMSMLYGLNTNDFLALPVTSPSLLSVEYNNILTQYNLTTAMCNTFWTSQLTTAINKLPGGCVVP